MSQLVPSNSLTGDCGAKQPPYRSMNLPTRDATHGAHADDITVTCRLVVHMSHKSLNKLELQSFRVCSCIWGREECKMLRRRRRQWPTLRVTCPNKHQRRDAATCPEHRATIKLNSGVFEVVALVRYEKRGCVRCRGATHAPGSCRSWVRGRHLLQFVRGPQRADVMQAPLVFESAENVTT